MIIIEKEIAKHKMPVIKPIYFGFLPDYFQNPYVLDFVNNHIEVFLLQLIEAAQLLVELIEKCNDFSGSSFALMPPKPELSFFEGYKLHVSKVTGIDKRLEMCVKNIVVSYSLSLTVEEQGLLIYRKR